MAFPFFDLEKLKQRLATKHVQFFNGSGAPVDGTTGAGSASKFDVYVRTNASPGAAYVNTGTKAVPIWTRIK